MKTKGSPVVQNEINAILAGNPAKVIGHACQCGVRLEFDGLSATCSRCGLKFQKDGGIVSSL